MRWAGKHGAAVTDLVVNMRQADKAKQDWCLYQGGCVALLAQLPNLRCLHICDSRGFFCPQQHLFAIEALTALTSLTLEVKSSGHWHSDVLEPLQHLTALTCLSVKVEGLSGPLLVAPALTRLTQLNFLYLIAEGCRLQGGQDQIMQTVSQLSNLKALHLGAMVKDIPAELAALEHLEQLYLAAPPFQNTASVIPACLTSCSNLSYISLANLSQATLKGWWGLCRSLLCLPALEGLTISKSNLAAVPPAAWALSTRLTFLNFFESQLVEIPAAACQLTSLRELRMCGTTLLRVAPGPYLLQMHRMTIHCDQHTTGPHALADAGHLQYLRVTAEGGPDTWSKENLASVLPGACSIHVDVPMPPDYEYYDSSHDY